MARMFHSTYPSNPAEHTVFEALKSADHTRNWTVTYSKYVPVHGRQSCEIDFVVIIPEYYCVICLEVKGGYFDIGNNGEWYKRSSGTLLSRPSPYDQAKDNMYDFKNSFARLKLFYDNAERNLPPEQRGQLSLGCAVAFKDINDRRLAPSEHLAKSIWPPDVNDPRQLVQKLKDIAKELSPHRRNYETKKKAQEDLSNLIHELRPSPMNRIRSSDLDTLREELLVLTSEQFDRLNLVKDNHFGGCVIDGAAGTGKTVLAMELARQRCEENYEKVALICSNPYLSSRFARWAQTLSSDGGGTVVAGTLEDFSTFDGPEQEKFDYLIVDEAQNMCDKESLRLMDRLLKQELTNGSWVMFGDFANQNIINPDLTPDGEKVLDHLRELYPRMALGRLEINCRNTYEIAAAVSMLVDIETPPRLGVHGPLLEIEYYDSDSPKNLDNLLDKLVRNLEEREFSSRQIILLSSSSDDFNTEPPREYSGWGLLNVKEVADETDLDQEDVPDVSGDSSPETLRYSNIHDFQGLESEVVILVLPLTEKQTEVGGDATLPDYDHLKRVLYVGMSRAKAILIIVADESYKEHLDLEPRFEPTYKEFIESIVHKTK